MLRSQLVCNALLSIISISDSDTFRAHHPVTTYEHYRDLVGRVASGEERVLTAEKPLVLAMTSGTSGPSAMLLSTKDTNSDFFLQVACHIVGLFGVYFSGQMSFWSIFP